MLATGLAAAFAILVLAGPAAAASTVVNSGGTVTVAQVEWAYDDDGRFVGGYLVAADDRQLGTVLEYFLYTEEVVLCEGAETPGDASDDRYDFRLVIAEGAGQASSFSIGQRYSSAVVAGRLTIVVDRFDGCTGDVVTETVSGVVAGLDVVATTPLVRESGHGSFHIPGELNAHGSFRQVSRAGDGVALIGGVEFAGEGALGSVSWRDHTSSR